MVRMDEFLNAWARPRGTGAAICGGEFMLPGYTANQAPSAPQRPEVSAHWSSTCRRPRLEKCKLVPSPGRATSVIQAVRAIFCGIPVRLRLVLAAGCFFVAIAAGQKSPQGSTSRDISELAPEDLMKLKVTSAANKEQSLSKVGAALFVITREDIASSGANNIPDLLRLVPGVEVAQINANQWAISIRGFNSFYSNKVLALIDGRALYQPSFSTVLWDMQDVPLEDIERIEVIRGPGGTIWGANAVNGVINIITRHARDTQGGLITAGAGSWRTGDGLLQYGGNIGSEGTYRAFAKYFDVSSSVFPGGQRASDGWHSWAAGSRSDWDLSPRDTLSVQADLRNTIEGGTTLAVFSQPQPFQTVMNSPIRNVADDVMGTWRHTLAGRIGDYAARLLRPHRPPRRGRHGYNERYGGRRFRAPSGRGRAERRGMGLGPPGAPRRHPRRRQSFPSHRSGAHDRPVWQRIFPGRDSPHKFFVPDAGLQARTQRLHGVGIRTRVLNWSGLPRSVTRCGLRPQRRSASPTVRILAPASTWAVSQSAACWRW